MKSKLEKLVYMMLLFSIGTGSSLAALCEFSLNGEWGSGFNATVKITNDSQQDIEGWSVDLKYNDATKINHMWNASLSNSNGVYTATNANYNRVIKPGSSASFGFNNAKANHGEAASIPQLTGICAASDGVNKPVAEISASQSSGSIPFTVEFDASQSTSPENSALNYLWDFADGTQSTDPQPVKTFEQIGDYRVSLVVSSDGQTSQPSYFNIQAVAPQPETAQCEYMIKEEWLSGFTAQIKIVNQDSWAINGWSVDLQYTDGTRISGSWDSKLIGSNPYQLANANYNANIAPQQYVTLGFNAQKGTEGDAPSRPILGGICNNDFVFNQKPTAVANASVIQGFAPLSVDFDASGSSDPDGDDLSYLWQFPNGETSELVDPSLVFQESGSYPVQLTVNDGSLSSETVELTIEVEQAPIKYNYQLDAAKSSLFFVSTKKTHIVEAHHFTSLTGSINEFGQAQLNIDLTSVETNIDKRNERMRLYLFETDLFPTAAVSLDIDSNLLPNIEVGSAIELDVTPILDLHGVQLELPTKVKVSKLTETKLLVQNLTPIILQATDFDLAEGVETLRELAGLPVISLAVPVNFNLVFVAQ
ncbi:cellulose binding domain-containing protein [Saccharobesus litoralis]|nr:cellulose binding domain-containing protein [Saccharobesus litoralis]